MIGFMRKIVDEVIHTCVCCVSRDGSISSNVVRDHVGNNILSSSQTSVVDVMQVSCTDSDKSPTESSYDLPLSDSAHQASNVCLCFCSVLQIFL